VTTLSFTAIIDPNNSEVFAQSNDTMGMMMNSSNMTTTTNATLADDCEENMTAEECDTGSISRRGSAAR
jgi:hypothetical protein